MITLTREEAQQVLDALEAEHSAIYGTIQTARAIETLRARLAEPEKEQEPVAWLYYHDTDDGRPILSHVKQNFVETEPGWIEKPLYTAPPQREWKGLTDAERRSIREHQELLEKLGPVWAPMLLYYYLAIEAKLKEKNA